jgi:dihydroflavonol-4-reductase
MAEKSKLYLVDGAKGHTGTFLVKELLDTELNCKIVATDLPTDERAELMKKETVFSKAYEYNVEMLKDKRVEFIPANLIEPDSLKALFEGKKYDVIFHPASLYDYFAKLDILRKINVEGTRNLLEIICSTQDLKKLRFLHWSTCGVYGQPKFEHDKKTKYTIPANETAPYDPPNNYSISKMEQEGVVNEFVEKKKLKVTIIRPGPIYGPYQTYGTYHILIMLRIMAHGIVPFIHPKKRRLWMPSIHVEDLARAAVFLAKQPEKNVIGEAYNVVQDLDWMDEWLEWAYQLLEIPYSVIPIWYQLFKFLAWLAHGLSKLRENKARKLGIRPIADSPMIGYVTHQYAFSNEKIKSLGFEFKYKGRKALKDTIDWYMENGWLPTEYNEMGKEVF